MSIQRTCPVVVTRRPFPDELRPSKADSCARSNACRSSGCKNCVKSRPTSSSGNPTSISAHPAGFTSRMRRSGPVTNTHSGSTSMMARARRSLSCETTRSLSARSHSICTRRIAQISATSKGVTAASPARKPDWSVSLTDVTAVIDPPRSGDATRRRSTRMRPVQATSTVITVTNAIRRSCRRWLQRNHCRPCADRMSGAGFIWDHRTNRIGRLLFRT